MNFPPELKPLLATVIVLAIVHAVIRMRRRRAASVPARRRVATVRREAPIDGLASEDPADALARLRQRSADGEAPHG